MLAWQWVLRSYSSLGTLCSCYRLTKEAEKHSLCFSPTLFIKFWTCACIVGYSWIVPIIPSTWTLWGVPSPSWATQLHAMPGHRGQNDLDEVLMRCAKLVGNGVGDPNWAFQEQALTLIPTRIAHDQSIFQLVLLALWKYCGFNCWKVTSTGTPAGIETIYINVSEFKWCKSWYLQ